jgi:hypothetical protein
MEQQRTGMIEGKSLQNLLTPPRYLPPAFSGIIVFLGLTGTFLCQHNTCITYEYRTNTTLPPSIILKGEGTKNSISATNVKL